MKNKVKIGVGFTSIIVIVLSFCLTIFAVNGLMTATENKRINDKRCEYTREYYEADKKATVIYSKLVEQCKNDYDGTDGTLSSLENEFDDVSFQRNFDDLEMSYIVPVNESISLSVKLSYSFIEQKCDILKWKTDSNEVEFEDETLNLWNGTFE